MANPNDPLTDTEVAALASQGKVSPEQLFPVDAMNDEQVRRLGAHLARGLSWSEAKVRFPMITDRALEAHRSAAERWATDPRAQLVSR